MSENGVWSGCGHKVKPIFFCDKTDCVIEAMVGDYREFNDYNDDDICFACWKVKEGIT